MYRHFPTPEALILAVYRREVRHLVDVVPTLLRTQTPEQAFRAWTGHLARYMITKRGLAKALSTATTSQEELFASAYEAMLGAISTLLEANVRAGSVRADLDPSTVLRALGGLLLLKPNGDWRAQTESLTDLLWTGMRADGCPYSLTRPAIRLALIGLMCAPALPIRTGGNSAAFMPVRGLETRPHHAMGLPLTCPTAST